MIIFKQVIVCIFWAVFRDYFEFCSGEIDSDFIQKLSNGKSSFNVFFDGRVSFVSNKDNETQLASQKDNFNKNEIKSINCSMDSVGTTTKKVVGRIPHLKDVGELESSNTETISLNGSKIEYPEMKFTKINTTPLDTLYHSTKTNEQSEFSLETTTLIECVEDKNASELVKHIDSPEDNWGAPTSFVERCTEEVNTTSQNKSTPLHVLTTESFVKINKESEMKEGKKFGESTTNVFEPASESEHGKKNYSAKASQSEGVEIFSTIPEMVTKIVYINKELDVSDELSHTKLSTEKIYSLETHSVAIEDVSKEPFAEKNMETEIFTETYDIKPTIKEKNVEEVISTETYDVEQTAKEKKIEEHKSTEAYIVEAIAKEKKKEKFISTETYDKEPTEKERQIKKILSAKTYNTKAIAKEKKEEEIIFTENYDIEPIAKEKKMEEQKRTEAYNSEATEKEKKKEKVIFTETYDKEPTEKERKIEDQKSTEAYTTKATAKENKEEEVIFTETYDIEQTAKKKKIEEQKSTEAYNTKATAKGNKEEELISTETYDIEQTAKEKKIEEQKSTEAYGIETTAKEKKKEKVISTETYEKEPTEKERQMEKILSSKTYNTKATAKEKKEEEVISTETYDIEPTAIEIKKEKVIPTNTYDNMEPTAKKKLHKSYDTTIGEKSSTTINERKLDKESFDITSTLGEDLFHQPYNVTIEEEPSEEFNLRVGMKGKTSDQPYVFETITKGIPHSRLDEFSHITIKEKLPKISYVKPTTVSKLNIESIEDVENIDDGVLTKKIYKPGFHVPNANFCPNNGTDVKLIVFVESQLNNFATRIIIRKTWKAYAIDESIKIVFIVGVKKDANETLDYECEVFNDIIQSRNADVHIRHSSLKFLSMIEWLLKYCSKVQFVAKTEEKIFLNIPQLLSIVNKLPHEQQSAIYGKYIKDDKRIKQTDDPHHVSDKSYSLDVFPPYPWGRLYLMQKPPLIDLYYLALSSIYVPLDDVWFGGIIAELLGLKKININNLVKECNNLGPIPNDYNMYAGLCLTTANEIEALMNKYIRYYY